MSVWLGSNEEEAVLAHNRRAAALWGSGGRDYEAISRRAATGIEHCVERLDPRPGEWVLDVATGTGLASRRVAERGADVVGVDIAAGLLDAARAIAGERRLRISYRLADAERLPFADGEFDAVLSTFGVMFTPDQEAAVAELARICRPGGRVAVAAWTPNSTAETLRSDVIVRHAPAPPAGPTPPSPFNWGDPDWLRTTLGRHFALGFETATLHMRFPDARASWEAFSRGFGPVRAVAEGLDAAAREAFRADFVAWMERHSGGLGVALSIDYLVSASSRR